MTEHDAALCHIHDALARLPGWQATSAEYRAEAGRWYVTAVDGRQLERLMARDVIVAAGATEAEALAELANRLEARAGTD